VTYGAGLNLFTNPLIGFFMRHLGAYTVDRRKADPLYRELLKEYTTVTLEAGQDNLFFPGGSRSRSGEIERRLKRGLLGTAVWAFRNNLLRGRPRPRVFVIPCTLSYPLVLEASTLIDDYLKEAGKSRYIIVDDEFRRVRRWVDFLTGLLSLDQRIHMTIAPPLDPFGNRVDEEGRSLDPRGRTVDPAGYLKVGGTITADRIRDEEYTQLLAERVMGSFRDHSVAMCTNLLAFAVFEMLRRRRRNPDLYRFLRELGPEQGLPQGEVEEEVDRLLVELRGLADRGRILLEPTALRGRAPDVVREALRTFGCYHARPVVRRRGIRLHVEDPNLLFYYRNRLEGYGLLNAPDLLARGVRR
jgi:glycerol-3-phosphate O-acyltransferase